MHQQLRSRGDAADRYRGVDGRAVRSTPSGCRRRCATRATTSSPSSRACNSTSAPAAVHGFPLHRPRPLARRVPAGPLRGADGRRADGRGVRARHVPRHRGPHLRRDRGGHQPQGTDPADSPAAAHPADRHPHCAWTVVIDESYPEVEDHPVLDVVRRTRAARTELDRIDSRTTVSPTTRAPCCPTSTSRPSRIRRWCGWPTRCACRCTC